MSAEPINLQGLSPAEYLQAESELTILQKSALAGHLAAGLKANGGAEFANAEALLRLMAWNAEPAVAQAMAKAAAANPNTPRSLAWALANDDEEAAKSVLEACASLSDADLVSIVQAGENAAKLCAIAKRESVSAEVSKSLVEHGNEDAVHTLLANANADIADDAYGTVMDRFGQSERIQEGIVGRSKVSAMVAQRLSSIAPTLAAKLAAKVAAPKPRAVPIPGYAEPRTDEQWAAHIAPMLASGALTETALTRHLTLGNLTFVVHALAALSKAPYAEVLEAVLASPPAFATYWERAGLPASWLPVAAAAASALIHVDYSTGKADPKLFSRNIIERTLANLKAEKITLTNAQQRLFATRPTKW